MLVPLFPSNPINRSYENSNSLFPRRIRISYYPLFCFAADFLTYQNDNARTGWNSNEVVLTPNKVNASSFGRIFTLPVGR